MKVTEETTKALYDVCKLALKYLKDPHNSGVVKKSLMEEIDFAIQKADKES